MAASSLLARSRVSARTISSVIRFSTSKKSVGFEVPSSLPTSRRACIQRLPLISASLLSMLPLHSAIASARLRSILSAESQAWGLIPQGGKVYVVLSGNGHASTGILNILENSESPCLYDIIRTILCKLQRLDSKETDSYLDATLFTF